MTKRLAVLNTDIFTLKRGPKAFIKVLTFIERVLMLAIVVDIWDNTVDYVTADKLIQAVIIGSSTLLI